MKDQILGRSELRRKIYESCDGAKTVREIAQEVGKSLPHVSMEISHLEVSGLIKARRIGKNKYYEKVI